MVFYLLQTNIHIDLVDRYDKLVELVNNPIRSGGPRRVAKILVVLSGIITDDKRHLANKTITHWQSELKRERPDENGCPYFAPSSQNQKLRTLFSALTKFHGWHLKLDSLKGFDGSLAEQLGTLYKERSEKYVSLARLIMMKDYNILYTLTSYHRAAILWCAKEE